MLLCKGQMFAPVAHAIHKECFDKPWTEKEFQELLALPTSCLWMDQESLLLCSHVLDEMEILTIGVCLNKRHQGKAQSLLSEMFDYAKQHQVRRVFLEVSEKNVPAIHLYEKMGFQPMGRRKGYYEKGKVDALTYQKTL